MRRRALVTAQLLAVLGLLALSWAGGLLLAGQLDQRFLTTRFELPRHVCPLAVGRDNQSFSPMCSAVLGW